MSTATTPRPQWPKIRRAIALIKRGVPPSRAFAVNNLQTALLDNPKAASMVNRAEATFQTVTLDTVYAAATGTGTQVVEGDWSSTVQADGSHAPTRTRAWSKRDWKSATWLLERRFPAEYGSQQPAQVAETVVSVLGALAALRQQPASLANLRHVPQLPSGEDARAREGGGTS